MDVSLAGKSTEGPSVLQSLKASFPMDSRLEPAAKLTFLSASQSSKAFSPMDTRLAGRSSVVMFVSLKALYPTVRSSESSSNVILLMLKQKAKASSPMNLTLAGMKRESLLPQLSFSSSPSTCPPQLLKT